MTTKKTRTYHKGWFVLTVCLNNVAQLVVQGEIELEVWLFFGARITKNDLPQRHRAIFITKTIKMQMIFYIGNMEKINWNLC